MKHTQLFRHMKRPFYVFSVCMLLMTASLSFVTYRFVLRDNIDRLYATGAQRLLFYVRTLRGAFAKFEHLPFVLARNEAVIGLLTGDVSPDVVNKELAAVNDRFGAAALYIMDLNGLTVAASNWNTEVSFVGKNFHFRPYFKDAVNGGEGHFFAIGTTSKQPGYYISAPIRKNMNGIVIGVAVVKIDLRLETLPHDWAQGGEAVFVNDESGIITLSSKPEWHYNIMRPLSDAAVRRIKMNKQYEGVAFVPWDGRCMHDPADALYVLPFGNTNCLKLSEPLYFLVPEHDRNTAWQLHYLVPLTSVHINALLAALAAGISVVFCIVLLLYIRMRQQRTAEMIATRARVKGAENERQRIVNDLHDDLGHRLRALAQRMRLSKNRDYIYDALRALRDVTAPLYDARPQLLTVCLADWRVKAAEQCDAYDKKLRWFVADNVLSDVLFQPEQIVHLQRILYESLNNALRHGGGLYVCVDWSIRENGWLSLLIANDGAPVDIEQWEDGLGRDSIRARAVGLGGTVEWQDNRTSDSRNNFPKDGGCTVRLRIPLHLPHSDTIDRDVADA